MREHAAAAGRRYLWEDIEPAFVAAVEFPTVLA